ARARDAAEQAGHRGRLRARARPRRGPVGARGAAPPRTGIEHAGARAGHGDHDRARPLLSITLARRAHRGPRARPRGWLVREPDAVALRAGDPSARMRAPITIIPPPASEKALLVAHAGHSGHTVELSLDELALLADTARARVVDRLVQRRGTVHPATFIGKGKLEELKELAGERGAEL